ncbi:MAG TPA: polyphenol oxidase family protein [Verrucomicrobiae bacterium]|nr:polyphenol oxidase family protein [Verrucomicrobiae bacterium]
MIGQLTETAPGIYVPDVHDDIVVAHSDRRNGNIDPRFVEGDEWTEARQRLFEQAGLHAGQVAVIGFAKGRGPSNEFVDLGDAEPPERPVVTDGLVTTRPGVGLMLNPADCLALALYHSDRQVLMLAHLGWRGIKLGLHTNMLEYAAGEYDVDTEQAAVYFSPSIGPRSYVAPDVDEDQRNDPKWEAFIDEQTDGFHLDFPGYVKRDLGEDFGITQIHDSGIDVGADPHHFSFTRLKDGTQDVNGRNGFVVAIRPAV